MKNDKYETVLQFITLLYGFVVFNCNLKWKFWQRLVFFFAVTFSLITLSMDLYFYRPRVNQTSLKTILFLVNMLSGLWTMFAVLWGLVMQKKLALASKLLNTVDELIAELEQNDDYKRPRLNMRLYLILQCFIAVLRVIYAVYGSVISTSAMEGYLFVIAVIYKQGVISVYYSHLSFVYHKIYLRYREINHQLTLLLTLNKELIFESQSKIICVANIRQFLGKIVKLINTFYAIPVSLILSITYLK